MRRFHQAFCFFLLAGACLSSAATYYADVNYDGTQGAPDGSASRPFLAISNAVFASNTNDNNVVLVADGTYRSILAGGQENLGTGGLAIAMATTFKGGYAGQTASAVFDWGEGSRVPRSTVIDLAGAGGRAFQITNATVPTLEGFTFMNANHAFNGGAVNIPATWSYGAKIWNCLFTNNVTTRQGGGLFLGGNQRNSEVTGCEFVNNQAADGGGSFLYAADKCVMVVRGNTWRGNTAGKGGGAYVSRDLDFSMTNCTFEGNTASMGGAICQSSGGNRGTYVRCRFTGNQSTNGAVFCSLAPFGGSSVILKNCLVARNSGSPALYIENNQNRISFAVDLLHTTIADNPNGGVFNNNSQTLAETNRLRAIDCVVVSNGPYGLRSSKGTCVLQFNDVYGHTSNYWGTAVGAATDSWSADPSFSEAAATNYRPAKGSILIDAAVNAGLGEDLDDSFRPVRYGYDVGCYEESALPGMLIGRPARAAEGAWPMGRLLSTGRADTVYFAGYRAGGDGGMDKGQWTWSGMSVTGRIAAGLFSGLSPDTGYSYRILASNSYDEVFTAPVSFTTRVTGAASECVWTAMYGTNGAAEGSWVPFGLPAETNAIVLSGTLLAGDLTWPAGLVSTVSEWQQEADYAGTAALATTFTNYSTAFTNFTVTGDMAVMGGSLSPLPNLYGHNDAPSNNLSYRLALTVNGNLTVGPGGLIQARNRGFKEGLPTANGGATHGGLGGGSTKTAYGSVLAPYFPGMGCMSAWSVTADGNVPGGGALWIDVRGTATVNGGIDATCVWNGGDYPRGGAGGSVYLRAGSISGTGFIRARGMNANAKSNTGNGGGGRVAVVLTNAGATYASFPATSLDAAAGTGGAKTDCGAAGSVYLADGAGQAWYVIDFVSRNGDLVDDKAHTMTAESFTNANLVLRNQALLGFLTATQTNRVKSLTADATSHIKFTGLTNRVTCDQFTWNGRGFLKGLYTSNALPAFLTGAGAVEVLVGKSAGTLMLVQ